MNQMTKFQDFLISHSGEISLPGLAVNLTITALLCAILGWVYVRYGATLSNRSSLARNFVDGGPMCVMLGDNLVEKSIRRIVERYRQQGGGAKVVLKEVADPQRFGVAELDGDRVVRILEKPEEPPSEYAVTGIYMYDRRVFDIIDGLAPSARGELEITDVNNRYIEWGEMTCDMLDGWWTDAGTILSLHRASHLVAEMRGDA